MLGRIRQKRLLAAVLRVAMLLLIASTCARADDGSVRLIPSKIVLGGPEARQLLVVEKTLDERSVGQIADGVEFTTSDAKVVKVENGRAIPVGDGTATITAKVEGQAATADVAVTRQKEPFAWSFRNHVGAVLSKAGCNGGACHGAAAGKNGFKLTLFGYDPVADYKAIARQDRGRRIDLADPGRSLVLMKPTGAVPHKGGVRIKVDSLDYRVLAEWIAAGAPPPRDDDAKLSRIEVLPENVQLARGAKQQLVVLAHYADGHVEDVTHWVKYTSANETVARVDASGRISVMGHGEGAISAWFANHIVMAHVTVPYAQQVSPEVFARSPRHNFIDDLALAKLAALNLPPSPPCSDAEFIRRAFLDTLGLLPTPDETRVFLADASPDKRNQLIETLLARSEYVDYWTYKWSDLLLVNSAKLKPPAMRAYSKWIRRHVAAGTPWDAMVRELVTAQGSTLENGAANFYVLHQDPTAMAETVSMAFLGMSVGCAKCHNHPLEKWTNDQYFGFANLFARVRAKDLSGEGNVAILSLDRGELVQPTTGQVQPPRPLDGEPVSIDAAEDRRLPMADWLTSPDNPYFTRSIVNRVWANFMGVGLVEKVDDMRLTNPASNEELLAALARHLVDERYDLKRLMRTILQSAAYQRDSKPLEENRADSRFYARYYPKRLPAEVLLDAISRVTDVPTEFPNYPKGTRALQLPDANVNSYFLSSFGRPERMLTCDCERANEPSMVQVLHISNGDTLNKKLEAKGNRIEKLLAAGTPDLAILEEIYLAALCRYPTEAEKIKMLLEFGAARQDEKRKVYEDLCWALLSGKEFLFNH
jgi:hypothetical protein